MQHQQQHQIAASFLEQHMNHDSDEEEKQLEDIRARVNNTTAATMMDIADEPLDIKPDPQLINIINRTSDSQQQQQQQQSSENQYNNSAVSSSHDISIHHNLDNINSSDQHNSESIVDDEQDNLQESPQHHQQSQSVPEQGYQV